MKKTKKARNEQRIFYPEKIKDEIQRKYFDVHGYNVYLR